MNYIRLPVNQFRINHPHLKYVTKVWKTETSPQYIIMYDQIREFKHLRIRRVDNKPIRTFLDLQAIKNDLLGQDVVAVEVFPRAKDMINNSHTYHIWSWVGLAEQVPNLKKLFKY